MTRGKYGSAAAKRRAESAEDQLDRLLPQLVDAKRLAARYRSEAERVPVLSRQLAELREKVGVPLAEHEAALREVERERDMILETYDDAVAEILTRLDTAFLSLLTPEQIDTPHINDALLMALYVIPDWVTAPILRRLGWERRMRRGGHHGGCTPWGADRLREAHNGRRSKHGGGKLAEVRGELGEQMVKFLSERADRREAAVKGDSE